MSFSEGISGITWKRGQSLSVMCSSVEDPAAPLLPSCLKAYDQTLQQIHFYATGHWWNEIFPLHVFGCSWATQALLSLCPLSKKTSDQWGQILLNLTPSSPMTPMMFHPTLPRVSLAYRQDLSDKFIKQSMKNSSSEGPSRSLIVCPCCHGYN